MPLHDPASDWKSAPTVTGASSFAAHDATPVQLPLHPPKSDPAPGAATSVTAVPRGKVPLHAVPAHVTPAGVDVMDPVPAPVSVTSRSTLSVEPLPSRS